MSNSNETTNFLLLMILLTLLFGSGAAVSRTTVLLYGALIAAVVLGALCLAKLIEVTPLIVAEIRSGVRDLALFIWEGLLKLPALGRWWLLVFCSPVRLPLQDWRNMQRARERGERVGAARMVASVSLVALTSCALWAVVMALTAFALLMTLGTLMLAVGRR